MGFIFDEFWVCVKGKAKKQKQKTKMGVGVSVSAVFRFFLIFFVGSLSLPVCRLLHFFFSPVLQSNMQMEADESSAPYLRMRDHISLRRGSFKKAEQDEDARRRKKLRWKSRIGRLCWASGWLCCHSSQKGFFHHKEKEGGERP